MKIALDIERPKEVKFVLRDSWQKLVVVVAVEFEVAWENE